ncbi:MAG: 4-hydroxybenzoate octaprenyltransferase [Planctomycetota bacterium]|nr:MAG: 4-hydroxybenzoate octaprenyltransferase [Planctomycetota bacterium]
MGLIRSIQTWGEMVKFSHSVFALPFAVFAAFLAARHMEGGTPGWGRLGLIVLCMVAARSFAMTMNRILDAVLDARNPRTMGRPIPAGRVTVSSAWAFAGASAGVFLVGCGGFGACFGNWWPLALSAPTLGALAGYSYAKRFTALAHFILGAVIAFAPVAAWIAVDPASLGFSAVLLCAAVALWIAGFDIIYSCQDVDVDRREGLFSAPARLGVPGALGVSRMCHFGTILLLGAVGVRAEMGLFYWAGVALTAVLLAAEQAVVRADDLSRVNLAFFTINGCVSLMLGTLGSVDVLVS